MAMRGSTDLDYTWYGVLITDCDALLVLEKCLRGELAHIPRRPHDSERARLIKSGSIFVYESNASGIKRWTDGINWSPSRILTNFLVYHELEKAPPPGEKKRAIKRKRSEAELDDQDPKSAQRSQLEEEWTDDDRRLMGSPQDNYGWKAGGLVKKTYSFDFRGASHHIISYFNPEDVRSGELKRPIHCESFQKTFIRPDLIEQGARSRNPITESQIEQQRWDRPLYQNDSSVSLMRQYPVAQSLSFPNHHQVMDYPADSQRAAMQQAPALMHRSSIQFPVEGEMYHSLTPATYQPPMGPNQLHTRHTSISGPVGETYQRPSLREHIARATMPIDTTSEASYPSPISTVHHSRSMPSLTQSPIETKPTPTFDDEIQESSYVPITQTSTGYTVGAASPVNMTPIDTAYSQAIARPTMYSTTHSAVQIPTPSSYYSPSAMPGPPPAKKGRIETSYQPAFSAPAWDRPMSAPVSATEMPLSHNQHAGLTIQIPFEPMSFSPTAHVYSAGGYGYPYSPEQVTYADVGPDYSVAHATGIYGLQAFSPQLTAQS